MHKHRKSGRKDAPVVFTGCSMTDAVQGQPHAGGQRRHVVVNGRRVKTIDVHAHCLVPEASALVGHKLIHETSVV